MSEDHLQRITRFGFLITERLIDPHEILRLRQSARHGGGHALRKHGELFAIRNLLEVPAVQNLALDKRIRNLVTPITGVDCVAVKATLFDKVPEANWKVPFHQDLTIVVRERRDVSGFGPWTRKAGAVNVQPPVPVLQNMIALRIHLDDCGQEDGPLRVIPGSHNVGRCSASDIEHLKTSVPAIECLFKAGDALLMRPLLLHASSASKRPTHRRVIHLEFGPKTLPGGLEWKYAI